jgi:ribosomal protein S21
MAKDNDEPLRGDAAYRAFKAQVAKNNDAAQRRGREQRAEVDAATQKKKAAAERQEMSNLPVQPEP